MSQKHVPEESNPVATTPYCPPTESPPVESAPGNVVESPQIGEILLTEIQAVNAEKQKRVEEAARLANID